jgi:Fuc2NAc and GlcNAc transferase
VLGLVDFWPWLILFGVFLVDATITLLRRMLRGERWYEAHCSHAYQHAARQWGHMMVTMFLNVINYLCLLPLALLTFYYPEWGWWIAMLAILSLVFLALVFKAGLPQES